MQYLAQFPTFESTYVVFACGKGNITGEHPLGPAFQGGGCWHIGVTYRSVSTDEFLGETFTELHPH